jgi:hypothetical protein
MYLRRSDTAALKPPYGVGIDFGAGTMAKASALHPELYFVPGDVEAPQTLAAIEDPIIWCDPLRLEDDAILPRRESRG